MALLGVLLAVGKSERHAKKTPGVTIKEPEFQTPSPIHGLPYRFSGKNLGGEYPPGHKTFEIVEYRVYG